MRTLRRLVYLSGLAGLLLSAGCEVGPDYRRPSIPTTPAYKEASPGSAGWKTASPADEVDRVLSRGTAVAREPNAPARFKPGDRVRARNVHSSAHTRLPRYVRGHLGTIDRVHGCHVFPDSNASGAGENPQWLYAVRFDGHELWGADGDPKLKVSVDAWESYLDPA